VARTAIADLEAYIAGAPLERRSCLVDLRNLCRRTLKGYEEAIAYGMPSYARNGIVEIAFASQKRHIALYVMKQDVMECHRDRLVHLDHGKGCIRFPSLRQVDFALVEQLLRATSASSTAPC
jgi:uncharacterized protein YdhG (YjbR/CyaY superfamily)